MSELLKILLSQSAAHMGSAFRESERDVSNGPIDQPEEVHLHIGSQAQNRRGLAALSSRLVQQQEGSQSGVSNSNEVQQLGLSVNSQTSDAACRLRHKSVLRILRRKQVEQRVGVCRSTLYSWISPKSLQYIPDFPKPIRIGNGAIGWIEEELEEFIEARIRASRNQGVL